MLIEQMALSKWRIERALSLELTAFNDNELNERMLALAIRYRTSAEREFHKSLNDLTRLRAANKKTADHREKFELQAAAIRAKYSSPDPRSLNPAAVGVVAHHPEGANNPAAESAQFLSRADYHFSEEGMRAFFRQQMAKMDAEVLGGCGRSTGD